MTYSSHADSFILPPPEMESSELFPCSVFDAPRPDTLTVAEPDRRMSVSVWVFSELFTNAIVVSLVRGGFSATPRAKRRTISVGAIHCRCTFAQHVSQEGIDRSILTVTVPMRVTMTDCSGSCLTTVGMTMMPTTEYSAADSTMIAIAPLKVGVLACRDPSRLKCH